MRKVRFLLVIAALSLGAMAQNSAPPAEAAGPQAATPATPANSPIQPGSLIYAELSKSIDAKKAKIGDPVVGKVTQAVLSQGKVIIPNNTKIVGHITAVKASTKDQRESELGIAFDRAELKNGTEVALTSVTIQALSNAPGYEPPSMGGGGAGGPAASNMPSSRPGGAMGGNTGGNMGGNMGGMNQPTGGYPSNPGAGGGEMGTGTGTGPTTGSGRLNAGSRGVLGMSGIKLQPQPQGGLITADRKNVKLDSGTQLVLKTQ